MLAQLTFLLLAVQQPLPEQVNPAPVENLLPFDWRQVEAHWNNRRWQLQAGGVWLKDFGQRDSEAREAARLVRSLQLTQQGTVGQPLPLMEYWLSNGHAPRALNSVSFRLTAIDRDSLRAEAINSSWCVRDNQRVFFNFGNQQAEAQRAVAIIQHHEFTHISYIGHPLPSFMYFVSNPGNLAGGAMAAPRSPAPVPLPTASHQATGEQKTIDLAGAKSPSKLSPEELKQLRQAAALAPQLSAPLTGKVATLRFDTRELALRQQGNDWFLYHLNVPLAGFGPDKTSAQQALELLQYHRCTEKVLIGQPPRFSYFLSQGQAPRGLRPGLGGLNFRPELVLAKKSGETWIVGDGERPLVNFGSDAEGAATLAQAIRRYQFDTLVWIGRGDHLMPLLLRAR